MLTLSIRNKSKIKQTPVQKIDELLESIGLIRHIVPKDGNSLFRCISQCVFLTQSFHINVRQHLLQYANLQTKEFNQMSHMSVYNYTKKITDIKIDGELLDMRIAAKVYNISFVFYLVERLFMPLHIKTPNSLKTLNLCLNHEGTYDILFIEEFVMNISICQAIVYEMLYNHVFELSDVQFAVKRMLFDRNFVSLKVTDQASLEKRATCTNMKQLLQLGITPFPFKVAKALAPNLYRNTEYDIWLNNKKEKFYGKCNNFEFKEGSKCMVLIGNQEYHCYIQHIRGKNEPVEVYVKNLAQKLDVQFNQLKLMSVEDNAKEMDSHIQVNQIFSTTIDENKCISQSNEQCETLIQFNNTDFIHKQTPHVIMAEEVFPSYYVNQYQQLPDLSLNSMNNENMMHSWYMATSSHILSNENYFLTPNFLNSSKVIGSLVQPISPLYSNHQPNISCKCVQCINSEVM